MFVQGYRFNNGPTSLCLNSLKLTELPESLFEFKNISSIYLCNNNITKLPRKILDFNLPIHLNHSENGKGIYLEGNEIEEPPIEIISKGLKAIKNYFEEIDNGELDFLNELKLIIVGEGRVGKTSIKKSLVDKKYTLEDEHSTEGIDIRKWLLEKEEFRNILSKKEYKKLTKGFRVNIWDFGGQEIYHSTHQFFLTKRSIYLLVTESRKEDKPEDFYYWLNLTQLLGENSPQLIVLNKCDQPTKEIPISDYKKIFKHIVGGLVSVSCKPSYKSTIEYLRDEIKRVITNNDLLPHIGTPLPKVWIDIRGELEKLKNKEIKYISLIEYLNLCKQFFKKISRDVDTNNSKLKERALFLSEYLHDIGAVLHFQNDFLLRDTIFLDNEWVTNAVYKILDNEIVIKNKGIFTDNDILRIWNQPEYYNKRIELLALMKNSKFDICFQVSETSYLAPQLLAIQSVDADWNSSPPYLYYEFFYEFMPKGILSRLIVKLHKLILDRTCWRYGVMLEYKNASALVLEYFYERKIVVKINGLDRRLLLDLLKRTLNEIHEDFHSLKVGEMIPCVCKYCSNIEKPFLFNLESLLMRVKRKRMRVECDFSYDFISVQEILKNVNINTEHSKNMKLKNQLFISYSHKNKEYLSLIQKHIKILTKLGIQIDYWDDTRITPGMNWKKEITDALNVSKAAILLITNDFLASDFISEYELPALLNKSKFDGTVILPIHLEYSLVEEFKDINQFQAANSPNNPLASLSKNEQEKILSELTKEIKNLFK